MALVPLAEARDNSSKDVSTQTGSALKKCAVEGSYLPELFWAKIFFKNLRI
jgi:hypothetical protein